MFKIQFKSTQLIKNVFITTFFISCVCVFNLFSQTSLTKSRSDNKNDPPLTQPLSLKIIKNLVESNMFSPNTILDEIFKMVEERKIDFDITSSTELELTSYLREKKLDLLQIERFIKRLKFINAEIKFLRLEGVFLDTVFLDDVMKKDSKNSKDFELLEAANELAELFLSSDRPKFVGKVYNLRGNIYFKQNNYNKAINELEKAIAVGFKGRATNQLLGQSYDAKGDSEKKDPAKANGYFRRAITYFSEAIRFDPDNEILFQSRGLVFQKIGEKEKAEKDFKKYNELKNEKEF